MKILIGYYTEKEMEVDDKFLPLAEKDEYADEDYELLRKLINKVDDSLSYPSELYCICDSDGNVMFEQ